MTDPDAEAREVLPVTQADREAAAVLSAPASVQRAIRAGRGDTTYMVQAFARHAARIAEAARADERERCQAVIETADYLIGHYERLWKGGTVRDLAEAVGAYSAARYTAVRALPGAKDSDHD